MDTNTLLMSIASCESWGSSIFRHRFFECFENLSYGPKYFDDKDPPSRLFAGSDEDAMVWERKERAAIGKSLFFSQISAEISYSLTLRWVDQEHSVVKSRGDFSFVYGSVTAAATALTVKVWQCLCVQMNAFHGFLDTQERYNRRAHTVSPDGTVLKTLGSYHRFLPGFFAYNYFGKAYTSAWSKNSNLSSTGTSEKDGGIFVASPSGFNAPDGSDPYSAKERDLIREIGECWFRLPEDSMEPKRVPSRSDFLEDRRVP